MKRGAFLALMCGGTAVLAGMSLFSSAAKVKAQGAKAGSAAESSELQKLDVSLGKWVFHGTTKERSGKTGSFTWNEDCQWSPNHLFLECTFSNVWSGKPVESLVV